MKSIHDSRSLTEYAVFGLQSAAWSAHHQLLIHLFKTKEVLLFRFTEFRLKSATTNKSLYIKTITINVYT